LKRQPGALASECDVSASRNSWATRFWYTLALTRSLFLCIHQIID
jgi:hypothetical protein